MTRLGLISDTHMPSLGRLLPPEVLVAFEGVDMILHAGDIFNVECLDQLEQIAPVIAVEEGYTPATGDRRVKHEQIIEVGGLNIGLRHDFQLAGCGWEIMPGDIGRRLPPTSNFRAMSSEIFFGNPIDIVVFGHTHYPMSEVHGGMLFINPGSPTLPRQQRKLGTVGILEIVDRQFEGRIINLPDLSR